MPNDELRQDIDARFAAGDERMTRLERGLADLRDTLAQHVRSTADNQAAVLRALAENTEVTKGIKEVVDTGKALFRLGGWIGSFIKWLGPIAAGAAAAWAWFTNARGR